MLGRGQSVVGVVALDPGDAEAVVGGANHARHLDRDLGLADLGEGVGAPGVIVEGERALAVDVIVGVAPVLAQHDRIGGNAAHLLDEAREMPGNLRVGRPVIGDGRRDRQRPPQLVDLDHPGHDRAPRGLPDEAAGKTAAQEEHAEEGEPPVFRLHAGRAAPVVPNLAGALIRRLRLGGCAVAHGRPFEHASIPRKDRRRRRRSDGRRSAAHGSQQKRRAKRSAGGACGSPRPAPMLVRTKRLSGSRRRRR